MCKGPFQMALFHAYRKWLKRTCLICVYAAGIFRAYAGEAAAKTDPNPAELLSQAQAFCSRLNSLACEIEFLRVARSETHLREMRTHFDVAFQRPNLLSIQMKADDTV